MPDDATPDADPQLDVAAVVEQIERRLLHGEREYTRADVAQASGLEPQRTRELWQALGFAAVDDDARAFTAGDVAALETVGELTERMALDEDSVRAITRMLGRTFSRLASWQGQLLVEVLGRSPELLRSGEDLVAALDHLLAAMEKIQSYVWRRQLAAYLVRVSTNLGAVAAGAETTMAVGFADMAQFTTFTRRASESDLRAVLEEFETLATDIIGAHQGQIVKTIGDEVLFVADSPVEGAEIALALLEAAEASERLPQLRVGLACGPVVSRLGDVFGQTVNIASRLTTLARSGTILVDEQVAEALDCAEGYRLSSLRPTSVRGYHHLKSWRLRRATS